MEVIASGSPVMTRERTIGAGGKRHTTGTYTLAPGPRGGALVTFEFAWERAPLGDRIAAPLLRGYLRRGDILIRSLGVVGAYERSASSAQPAPTPSRWAVTHPGTAPPASGSVQR